LKKKLHSKKTVLLKYCSEKKSTGLEEEGVMQSTLYLQGANLIVEYVPGRRGFVTPAALSEKQFCVKASEFLNQICVCYL